MSRMTALWKSLVFSLVFFLSLSSASMVSAGTNTWTSIGPAGDGLYSIAINPAHPNIIYAGSTDDQGVFKTTDGGDHWNAITSGMGKSKSIYTMVFDPAAPPTLYAIAYSPYFLTFDFYKTTDGGANWSSINSNIPTSPWVDCLAIDPGPPGAIFVGAYGLGVYTSTDGGDSWTSISHGLPTSGSPDFRALTIDPTSLDTLYVGTDSDGVYKTTDNGANWTAMNSGLTHLNVESFAINPKYTNTLYAGTDGGVFKSVDGGANWGAANSGITDPYINSLAIDPVTPADIFAGTNSGVFKSTDNGGTWSLFNTGLTNTVVSSLAFDPVTAHKLYAGTGNSVNVIHEVPHAGTFGKSAPSNAANASTSPTLSWETSSDASSYEDCFDTINNDTCDTAWISTGTSTSAHLSGLTNGTTYYWQVRAVNAAGNTQADGGTWWSFKARTVTFTDVPASYWDWAYIETIYANGITSGCSQSPLMYCPGNPVTREQMAVFILKSEHGSSYVPPAMTGVFSDVPIGYWAGRWIEQLYHEGITSGCSQTPLLYCPTQTVTREQMAVFLMKGKHGTSYVPPAMTGVFTDVPVGYWAGTWIEQLYHEGITSGCSQTPLMYCPTNPVTRDQMAVFLTKTFSLLWP